MSSSESNSSHPITRPMLAVDYAPSILAFPVIASPKIDGLRCVKVNGKALTRSFKEIPNAHIRSLIQTLPDGVDGELTSGTDFRESTGNIRCEYGSPKFTYWVFDYVKEGLLKPFHDRLNDLNEVLWPDWVKLVPQHYIHNDEELEALENEYLAQGFEGLMLRKPNGPYKCNRSTLKEGYLLKVKRFLDGEAKIIDFYEQEANNNEAYINQLGTTSRSSHADGRSGKDTLGGIVVQDVATDVTFSIGTGIGWTKEWREVVWKNQDDYRNRIVRYKHLPHGNYDVPRNASMQGFREEFDL